MNQELITLNEVFNTGNTIYFYNDEITATWVTFGYSAYLLSRFDNITCLATYSNPMQMPCVTLSEAEFKILHLAHRDSFTAGDSGYLMSVATQVDETQYQAWVQGLR